MKKCLCIFCALMFLWIGMPAYAQSIPEAENWKRMTDGTAIGLSAESYVTNTTPIPCTFTTDSFYASQLTAQLLIGSNGRVAIGLKRVQATIENELGVDKDFTLVLTDSSGTTQQLPGCMDSGSPWITFDKNASRKIIQALYRGDAFTFSLMGPLVSPLNSPSVYLFTMKNTAELESCLPPTNVTTLLNRLIAVEKSNLWHVMDPVGGIVIPGVYHTVVDDIALNGELALLANADEMILLNRAGEIVGSYDQIDIFDLSLIHI